MNLLGRSSSSTSDNGTLPATENSSHAKSVSSDAPAASSALDLDFLIRNQASPLHSTAPKETKKSTLPTADDLLNGDDAMVDLSDDSVAASAAAPAATASSLQVKKPQEMAAAEPKAASENLLKPSSNGAQKVSKAPDSVQRINSSTDIMTSMKTTDASKLAEVKPLNDISVSLDSIKPGKYDINLSRKLEMLKKFLIILIFFVPY